MFDTAHFLSGRGNGRIWLGGKARKKLAQEGGHKIRVTRHFYNKQYGKQGGGGIFLCNKEGGQISCMDYQANPNHPNSPIKKRTVPRNGTGIFWYKLSPKN